MEHFSYILNFTIKKHTHIKYADKKPIIETNTYTVK